MNRIAAFILATATALFSFCCWVYYFGFSLFLFLFIPLASRFKLTGRNRRKFGFGHSLFSGGKHVLAADAAMKRV